MLDNITKDDLERVVQLIAKLSKYSQYQKLEYGNIFFNFPWLLADI